jgi:fermentation-respiration switch protein FrsA (DUF1100 family)
VSLGDLLSLRDLAGAAWTPGGKDVIIFTNITGCYNLWRVPVEGGFPQQLIQSDEAQSGIVVKKDGASVLFESDKAPMLVIQGDNDPIVPKPKAEQMVSILKSQGNVVKALYYPDEGHGLEKIEHQRDSLEKKIAWFERHLKGKK